MLNKFVEIALRYKVLVLLIFAVIIAMGVKAWREVPVDAFPDVTPVQVNVYTESPGLAAEDVEKLLTFPVETAMAGLPGVNQIRSISLFGLSYVSVYFDDNVDIYFARRLVGEKLQEAKQRLPEGYGEPVLGPNSSGLGQVFWYALESADHQLSVRDLRTLQDWTVRVMLRTVPGVDDITSWGGQEKQYQVLIDPQRLIKYGLDFHDVMQTLAANNRQVGGQHLDVGDEQYLVRGLGLLYGTKDIGNVVIATRGATPIYVKDVADVKEGAMVRFGAVTKDGREVVLGMVLQRIGENAKNVVDAVKHKLEVVRRALPKGVTLTPLYDRTDIVERAVATAKRALVEGSMLVAVMLLLFLGELRSALVVIVALPVAMLVSFIMMQRWGVSANLMSLAGLAVGIGMMVDGAVVMVENAYRQLSVSNADNTADRTRVVLAGASEVVNPIAFAILIIIVVFLPLFTLTGLEGKLFKPMALAIAFAMAGSLALTLTLVPVLSALILKRKDERDTFIVRWAKTCYLPLLNWSLDNKRKVLGVALILLTASLALVPLLGREFMPTLREGSIMFRVTSIPSTSLEESIRVARRIDSALKAFPQTASTLAMIGRAEKGETADVNYMEILVNLKSIEHWNKRISIMELSAQMQEALERSISMAVITATQPIQSRIEELISGVRSTLALKLYGEDLPTLDRLASELKVVLEKVPGVTDLSIEANKGKPQLIIKVDRDQAARYGINADDVLEVVQAGIGGKAVSTLIDGVKRFDISVRLAPEFRNDSHAISIIPIRTRLGALVQLSQVASVELTEGYSFIRREQLQRYAVVQMDVKGRDVAGFVKDANAAIGGALKLPQGYWIEWGGAFENQQRAMARLAVIVPLTIGLIFVLLYTAFNSLTYAALIIANVPFATIGGLVGLLVTQQYLSVPSTIGFIAVFGVAMLNGIVLVSFLNEQREQGFSIREAVQRAAVLRLRPVLMTASISIFGLVPMLLSTGAGAETQRPLATVVVCGLFTSTVLTLLLLPLMYEWIETRRERRSAPE